MTRLKTTTRLALLTAAAQIVLSPSLVGGPYGDGIADIVSRDSTGRLWFYPAKGGGFFAKKPQIGTGW